MWHGKLIRDFRGKENQVTYKRGKWFWADFTINGVRYRVPLKDPKGHKIPADEHHCDLATRAEEREIMKAEKGDISPQQDGSGRLPFMKAADEYLISRRLEIAESSLKKENELASALKRYFGNKRLSAIRTSDVIRFRELRSKEDVGPTYINMEVGCLRRILKRVKLWHLVGDGIKRLREPQSIGRALTHEERVRLFKTAAQKPEWETAFHAAVLAVNTTARKCELLALQWRHVDFINRTLEIPKSKTDAGIRVVPLNSESYEVLWKLRRRSESFGPVDLSHFVFAALRPKFRFNGQVRIGMEWSEFDPCVPVGSWRTAWRSLTKKAGLGGLRFHDLRHTAISALGEAGVPDRVIMDIAGHVSPRMLRRYSHIQLESKRAAIQALSSRPVSAAGSNDTNYVTKRKELDLARAQVVETNGRPERARTVDLHRVKVAL
jgi:integrase